MNAECAAAIETCLGAITGLSSGDDAYDAVRHIVFQMFMVGPHWRETWPAFVMGLEEQFKRADTLTGEPAGHA